MHGFHPEHTERLAAHWAEAFGGQTDHSDSIDDEARDQGFGLVASTRVPGAGWIMV